MDERGVLGHVFCLAGVAVGVGPFIVQAPVEPFDLAVGLRQVGASSVVLDGRPKVSTKSFDLYGAPLSVNTRATVPEQIPGGLQGHVPAVGCAGRSTCCFTLDWFQNSGPGEIIYAVAGWPFDPVTRSTSAAGYDGRVPAITGVPQP